MGLPAIPAPTNLATLTGWVRVNANSQIIIPANCVLLYAVLAELNLTNVTTLHLTMGLTNGGSEILSSQDVPGGGLLLVAAEAFTKIWFGRKVNTGVWLNSANWPAGAAVSAQLIYQPGP